MSSAVTLTAPELVFGNQTPTIRHVPEYVSTSGPAAVKLAQVAGLDLDPWQQDALYDALGEGPTGRWAAFEVALLVARQNGKGGFFEARVLAGLFLLRERLILYSAHEFKTAAEMFRRIESLIDGTPMMRKRVKSVSRSKGDEGIELTTGQRLRFVARSKSSGRGFSGDCNILDESQHLAEESVDALMPTMSARPNPQLLYGGSAPDKDIAPCDHMARVRRRALAGQDRSLVYLEWSADLCSDQCPPGCDQHDDPADPMVWAKTNPAMGYRISRDHIARERESMGARGFARERLSVGNYPSEHGDQWDVIPEQIWRDLGDPASASGERVAFAIAVSPRGASATIGVAGIREDGRRHIEVIDHRPGTGWTVDRAFQLRDDWDPAAFVIDPGSPAGFLIPELEADREDGTAGITLTKMKTRDVAQAYGLMLAACGVAEDDEATLRYRPHPALDAAVAGATSRKLGDASTWDTRSPSVDISPLRAVTQALWGLVTAEDEEETQPFFGSWR